MMDERLYTQDLAYGVIVTELKYSQTHIFYMQYYRFLLYKVNAYLDI